MELRTPLRIYWDLPVSSEAPCGPEAICPQIVALRVLALDLHWSRSVLGPELWDVLQRVQGSPLAVTVTAAASALPPEQQQRLRSLGVRGVLLEARSLAELRELGPETWREGAGISFPVSHPNLSELPGVLDYCRDNGIKRLVFPIPRALQGGTIFYLGASRGSELGRQLRGVTLPERLQLTIHDPLLWKAFYPELPFPEGGCQAGNSMIYLAPDATLYPCPVLPYRLGSLGEQSLTEIVASPGKLQLRQRLLTAPAECQGCAEVRQCQGGCRGKGYLEQRSWEGADPSCR